jgi:hypothetical protein
LAALNELSYERDKRGMGELLFIERFIWVDDEPQNGHHLNALKLAAKFEIRTTAQ